MNRRLALSRMMNRRLARRRVVNRRLALNRWTGWLADDGRAWHNLRQRTVAKTGWSPSRLEGKIRYER
jgi:hypothetical protein